MTNTEISQWIDNDEGLYDWWRRSRDPRTRKRMSKTAFIRENRAEIIAAIEPVLTGNKPAHHLKYGAGR